MKRFVLLLLQLYACYAASLLGVDQSRLADAIVEAGRSVRPAETGKSFNFALTKGWNQYYGKVDIGTPAQSFLMVFDTNTTTPLVVPSVRCVTCGDAKKKKYNHTASSTFRPTGTTFSQYEEGFLYEGPMASDQVTIGQYTLKEVVFGEVDKQFPSADLDYPKPYSGVVGLGLTPTGQPPIILRKMVEQGIIDDAVYSIFYGSSAGELTFGGSNPDRYTGDFYTVDSLNKNYLWTTFMNGLEADGAKVGCKKTCLANFVSSFPVIVGPVEDMKVLNRMVGVINPVTNKMYCTGNPPNVTFTIGDRKFTVAAKDYLIQGYPSDVCYSPFFGADIPTPMGNMYLLGHPFFKAAYTRFDVENAKIGFATPQKD